MTATGPATGSATPSATTGQRLVIGTYTERLPHVDGKAPGILETDYQEGGLGELATTAQVRNPSWVAVTGDGRFLYSVVETTEFEGRPGGGVAAFARDPRTGALTPIGTAPSGGTEPAHLALDPDERFVLVANYRTGSVAVFARQPDGGLGERVEHVQHEGSSTHPVRQTGPHAHQVLFDPVTGLVWVPDLGLDAVLCYRLEADGRLTERPELRIGTVPGAGPRHLAFHPDGRHLFLLNELDNTLVVLRRSGDGFEQVQVASTLPEDWSGHNQTSAVRASTSGRWVWAANRGHDSIAMFAVDPESSRVELRHVEPTRGSEPRDFIETPDGHLLVANQDSDAVVTLAVDEDGGRLSLVGTHAVPTPVCLVLC
ncbi:lactonase family protein [Nakamurella endophytica]|uniref:6-phosphogluconolactonase n=1 Tax=Nakamurella endophytica TaxID=1748367 RepID=A0A917WD40_9ACTN|nr:lactonase family protein [Nakamurella endophytica]GGL93328.1 6-phosphogluconolactonase [Nakamurella endophytica]